MASTYTWSVISGTVPPGLSLTLSETDLDIDVTGTPTLHGNYSFTVRIENDVSGAFDEQAYSIYVDPGPSVLLAPDTGQSMDYLFDYTQNPKLVVLPAYQMEDVTGDPIPSKYQAANGLVFEADLGSGVLTYRAPKDITQKLTRISGRYLWCVSTDLDTVYEIRIV